MDYRDNPQHRVLLHRVAGVYAATVVYFYSGEWRVFTPALTGMAVDRQGRIWVVETGPSPNTFVGFDPTKNTIISITPIPSGAGSVRHMHYHAATGTVWFGTDEDTIGRAALSKP